MHHRIRGATIVLDGDRILLVKHQVPDTGAVWWIPPGGGVEGTESVFECAAREAFEESGLTVDPDRIVYLREYIGSMSVAHGFEVFILCSGYSGTLTTANIAGRRVDEDGIKDARFLSRSEMSPLVVYPEELKDKFWEDLGRGFPGVKYLGMQWM